MLSLFAEIQLLLKSSSLDATAAANSGKRYDHQVDQPYLRQVDANDSRIAEVAETLVAKIEHALPFKQMLQMFPLGFNRPVNNAINREVQAFAALLNVIRDNVMDVIDTAHGTVSRPAEAEAILRAISLNQVPRAWLEASFVTAHKALSDYMVELGIKLSFWNSVVQGHQANSASPLNAIPVYWLPAFSNPQAFLDTLAQRRSRTEGIPISMISTEWEVMNFLSVEHPSEEPFSMYLSGFWLEGADWDLNAGMLVETTTRSRFTQFPVVKLTAASLARKKSSQGRNPGSRSPATSENASPRGSCTPKSPRFKKTKGGEHSQRNLEFAKAGGATPAAKVYHCPVYKSTDRLSRGGATDDAAPICYLRLPTLEEPKLWIKRGVALVLEPQYDGVNE